jgi:hypothetical protein
MLARNVLSTYSKNQPENELPNCFIRIDQSNGVLF